MKTKLYYKTFQVEIELSEHEHLRLMKNWHDRSNRGFVTTVKDKDNKQYDIDLTVVQLIETKNN